MENLKIWNQVKQPPEVALKQIKGGRLSGMTDISPQWRYLALTEQFGPCGIGWKYEVVRLWNEPGTDGQVFAFAEIKLYIKTGETWSDSIPGIGGSMLVTKESKGLHSSDEGYKMAVTDALSVATKMLGVAADVYAGLWDGSKYKNTDPEKTISEDQITNLSALASEVGADHDKFLAFFKVKDMDDMVVSDYNRAVSMLESKRK